MSYREENNQVVPPREVPKGVQLEWVADPDWKVGGDLRECSRKHCHASAVASFCRPVHRNGLKGLRRYYYCGSHLYGRKIEDGVVKFERLVRR
jgi:hypothetical protein